MLNNQLFEHVTGTRMPHWQDAVDRYLKPFLLGKDADIEATEERRLTVLQKTARRGDKEMVEFLLSKGADVNAASGENVRRKTPLG